MWKRMIALTLLSGGMAVLVLTTTGEALSQGKFGGGGRNPGNIGQGAPKNINAGPAMTRPAGMQPPQAKLGGGNVGNPGAGAQRPNGGFQRPNAGNNEAPKLGGGNLPGKGEQPKLGAGNFPGKGEQPKLGGGNLPGTGEQPKLGGGNLPGRGEQPKLAGRPGGASSDQLNDFLGGGNRPAAKQGPGQGNFPNIGKDDGKIGKGEFPNLGKDDGKIGKGNFPNIAKDDGKIGKGNLPNVVDRKDSPNINVGNVNIGNSVDYSKNQQAWVNNQHNTGNVVRNNSGNRYAGAYNSGAYRRGAVGGYPYYNGWNNHGAYYGWKPVTYAAVGAFTGAAFANAQPKYYAYGSGGNVYYENNVVYVDGQPAGTPEQYAQQSTALLATAPAQVAEMEEWLPLGTYAFTREGVDDSQAMLELAVNKKGVIAGTYYNEATSVSRPLKGMIDPASQRVAIGFADGKNADLVLETGVNNLTQDEAPGLLHQGKDRSTPVLLVRLQAPADNAGK